MYQQKRYKFNKFNGNFDICLKVHDNSIPPQNNKL